MLSVGFCIKKNKKTASNFLSSPLEMNQIYNIIDCILESFETLMYINQYNKNILFNDVISN